MPKIAKIALDGGVSTEAGGLESSNFGFVFSVDGHLVVTTATLGADIVSEDVPSGIVALEPEKTDVWEQSSTATIHVGPGKKSRTRVATFVSDGAEINIRASNERLQRGYLASSLKHL